MDVSLLVKWWWKLKKEDSLWQEIVKIKYLKKKSIFDVSHKVSDWPVWADLLKVKDMYIQGRGIRIRNGPKTRFWYDPWLYDVPIYKIAPVLFILNKQKEVTVADIKTGIVQLTFSRWLSNELQTCLRLILDDVDSFQLQDDEDEVFWKLSKSKRFSVNQCMMPWPEMNMGMIISVSGKEKLPKK